MKTTLRRRAGIVGHWTAVACLSVVLLLSAGSTVRARPTTLAPLRIDCSQPRGQTQAAACTSYEQQILDATVHMRFDAHCTGRPEGDEWWYDSHASIVDEHTLLTHDHYRILGDERCTIRALILETPNGKTFATINDAAEVANVVRQLHPRDADCPMQACVVTLERPYLKPSAGVHLVALEAGALARQLPDWPAVATVNWRGLSGSTYVQWARPTGIALSHDVPVLEMGKPIELGASGGGVYVVTANGLTHIGNNWSTQVDGTHSYAALNSESAVH